MEERKVGERFVEERKGRNHWKRAAMVVCVVLGMHVLDSRYLSRRKIMAYLP